MEIEFFVQGSAPVPYRVVFKKVDSNIVSTCTCPAGKMGQYCKHRIRILSGDPTGLKGENRILISEIQKWITGTEIEKILLELRESEQQIEAVKARIALNKKRLTRFFSAERGI